MYLENRTCEEYLSGLKSFISAAEVDKLSRHLFAICCPCLDCEDVKKFSTSIHVHAHLIIWGFMDDYLCWNQHGEEGVNDQDLHGSRMGEGISANQQIACKDGDEMLPIDTCYGPKMSVNLITKFMIKFLIYMLLIKPIHSTCPWRNL
jgi:hypothetical protein